MTENKQYYGIYFADGRHFVDKGLLHDIQIKYPKKSKGDRIKSFGKDKEEAEFFSINGKTKEEKCVEKFNKDIEKKRKNLVKDSVIAFTDGSCLNTGNVGFGGVILQKNKIISYCGPVKKYKVSRNVSGEFMAADSALKWAIKNQKKHITIYHDLEIVDDNKRDSNKEVTRRYYSNVKKYRNMGLEIEFINIKGHKGIKYNEEADGLAKEGAEGKFKEIEM